MNLEKFKKLKRKKRMKFLKDLVSKVLSGDFSSERLPIDRVLDARQLPRAKYVSTDDRSSYNYGYMDSYELGAGSDNWGNW